MAPKQLKSNSVKDVVSFTKKLSNNHLKPTETVESVK
uniref:Uncharacterized protein n=1 Tax=Heterorhabditis bacteriophora TaxID=37862 RepID=A0A1I7WLZ4_HETBA